MGVKTGTMEFSFLLKIRPQYTEFPGNPPAGNSLFPEKRLPQLHSKLAASLHKLYVLTLYAKNMHMLIQ